VTVIVGLWSPVMPGEGARGGKSTPPLRTLADMVNWLISTAHPAGRGSYGNAEVAALIRETTGEPVSHTTIWRLRNGQATNPQKRLIEAMARTFGVRPAFFFGSHDENLADLVQGEAKMLAMIRDAGITAAQLRPLLALSPEARRLIIDFVTIVARDEARRHTGQGEDA
jgi:transcriptional regulator with XRE-family HTH domain